MIIGIIGPGGCGKSYLAKLIAEKLNGEHHSFGDDFRALALTRADIGHSDWFDIYNSGQVMPHAAHSILLNQYIELARDNTIVIDGLFRELEQVEVFEKKIAGLNVLCIYLNVSAEIIRANREERTQALISAGRPPKIMDVEKSAIKCRAEVDAQIVEISRRVKASKKIEFLEIKIDDIQKRDKVLAQFIGELSANFKTLSTIA